MLSLEHEYVNLTHDFNFISSFYLGKFSPFIYIIIEVRAQSYTQNLVFYLNDFIYQ